MYTHGVGVDERLCRLEYLWDNRGPTILKIKAPLKYETLAMVRISDL